MRVVDDLGDFHELDAGRRAPARSAIYKGGSLPGLTDDRVFAGHV